MSVGKTEIINRFGHHSAAIEGPNPLEDVHQDIRAQFVALAIRIDLLIPDGRAKSVAFTELESASMWAHKALAQQLPTKPIEDV